LVSLPPASIVLWRIMPNPVDIGSNGRADRPLPAVVANQPLPLRLDGAHGMSRPTL